MQGVGFRPMVYQLALACQLRGEVYNDAAGVVIRLAGTPTQVDQFFWNACLPVLPPWPKSNPFSTPCSPPPPSPRRASPLPPAGPVTAAPKFLPMPPPAPSCLAETLNPASRFYRYPFTNCTHCGPRLSIIRAIPYDRGNTSMAGFPMCPTCQAEYSDSPQPPLPRPAGGLRSLRPPGLARICQGGL